MGKLVRMGGVSGVVAAIVMAIAASGSAAPADSTPQIYVGSAPNYTIAFKVEGGSRVSVLALDAPIFCTFSHPKERFPGTMYTFPGPTSMGEARGRLEAKLRPDGGPSSYVAARLGEGTLSGTFALDQDEGSADCQTSGYSPARPAVNFETVPYESAGSGATKSPAKGEVPLYYGNKGGLEVLLETVSGKVDIRGAAPAVCPVAGKYPVGRRAPLLSDVEDARLKEGGVFHRVFRHHGKIGGEAWGEAITMSGTVEAGAITGSYLRTTTTRPAEGPPSQCKVGPLSFSAARYAPVR